MIPDRLKIVSARQAFKKLAGSVRAPADKSITHRAVLLAALSTGKSRIRNPLLSGDCLSTVRCFKKLGVPIRVGKNEIRVGPGKQSPFSGFRAFTKPSGSLDCGNSGTTMRLLSGVLSAQPFPSRLTGDASLSRRPMKRVIEPLSRMGAGIAARKGQFAPLVIQGRPSLKPIHWETPVASAQVKSAILLAGLFAPGRTSVTEPVRSRDHSERMLKALGAKIDFRTGPRSVRPNRVSIRGGAAFKGLDFQVPGDFSSAAFFIVGALLVAGSRIEVCNVNLNPTRTGLLNVLKRMGADIKIKNTRRVCSEPVGDIAVRFSRLKGTAVRPSEIPSLIDEIPILAVAASQAGGQTVISGAEELRVKESDRLAAVARELGRMGADIREKKDGLIIRGGTALRGTVVDSHEDHRMAMSLAVAGLAAAGTTDIRRFGCVRISFPDFLDKLNSLVKRGVKP